jgi:hypothetical protein
MSNTLTDLYPDIYLALKKVARERVGFLPAVTRNSTAEQAALNQTIRYPIVPVIAAGNNTPAAEVPDTGDATIGNGQMSITKSRHAPIRWEGEEEKGIESSGQLGSINQQRFEQAFRVLCNEVEADLAALHQKASRAFGTAATAPFADAAHFADFAEMAKILEDNGTPPGDWKMVLGSAAILNLRGIQTNLFKVNEAGSEELLRRGVIGQIMGFDIHNSAQVVSFTKGTGANYTSSTAGFAIGTTSIPIITGTGTVLAGDFVTFTGDSNKYLVTTGVSAPGTIVIAEPGLKIALAASAVAMTVGGTHTPNLVFHQSALQLVTRLPAYPSKGDKATDRMTVTDPVSGLSFGIAAYPGFLRSTVHVNLAWGCANVNPEFSAVLLG